MRRRAAPSGDPPTTSVAAPDDVVAGAAPDGMPAPKRSDPVTRGGTEDPSTAFECNICFDTPKDPVVTRCGHLYCWSCLYRWMRQRTGVSECPVCKASVERDTVTPIYGRGRTDKDDPRDRPVVDDERLPPRPRGERTTAAPAAAQAGGAPMHGNPYWHPAAFGRLNAYTNMNGNLALATFGNFPSLFGMEIAYPQFNEPAAEMPRLTPEQETREQVAKVFLFLALFIIVILTLF